MSRPTFEYLCEQLSPILHRMNTTQSLSVKKRVAITLWCLATPGEYRTISHLFETARSTVCEIVHETCHAIVDKLMSRYITFPRGIHLDRIVDTFSRKWGLPQCVGAIDGCHIPIAAPVANHNDYYNRKGWYSMILQGIVDANYCFLDVCIRWPGSVHDARVFAHSNVYRKITEEQLLPQKYIQVQGVDIPVFLIGDSAYLIKTWLMKPFPQNRIHTEAQKTFNYRLSRARIVVENAYGRLKGRCVGLQKGMICT